MKTDLHKFVVIDGMIIAAIRKSDAKQLTFNDIYYRVSLLDNQYTESSVREAVNRLLESNHIVRVKSINGNNHVFTIKTNFDKKYDFTRCFCDVKKPKPSFINFVRKIFKK